MYLPNRLRCGWCLTVVWVVLDFGVGGALECAFSTSCVLCFALYVRVCLCRMHTLVDACWQGCSAAPRVVVAQGFGIAEGLQQGVGGQHAPLQLAQVGRLARVAVAGGGFARVGQPVVGHASQVLHDDLGRLRFAGARLARDDNGLIQRLGGAVVEEVLVGRVRHLGRVWVG